MFPSKWLLGEYAGRCLIRRPFTKARFCSSMQVISKTTLGALSFTIKTSKSAPSNRSFKKTTKRISLSDPSAKF